METGYIVRYLHRHGVKVLRNVRTGSVWCEQNGLLLFFNSLNAAYKYYQSLPKMK